MKKSLSPILRDKHYWKNILNLYWGALKNACVLILIGGYILPRPSFWQILIPFVIFGITLFLSSLAIRIYLSQREETDFGEKKD